MLHIRRLFAQMILISADGIRLCLFLFEPLESVKLASSDSTIWAANAPDETSICFS